jgi:hypothetical protein
MQFQSFGRRLPMIKNLRLTMAIFMFTQVLFAQVSAEGKWTGVMPAANGGPGSSDRFSVTLDLRVKGTELTGTMTIQRVNRPGTSEPAIPTEIADGKVEGNTISFRLVRPGYPTALLFTATIEGDVMNASQKPEVANPRPVTFTLKRSLGTTAPTSPAESRD